MLLSLLASLIGQPAPPAQHVIRIPPSARDLLELIRVEPPQTIRLATPACWPGVSGCMFLVVHQR
jgi:hypothetical protein